MIYKALVLLVSSGSMFYGALYSLELPRKHMDIHTLHCIRVESINPLLTCDNIKPPYEPVYVWDRQEK